MRSVVTHASVGMLPNFLLIGAMKAGTTSLYHYLRAHPQIYMSPVKEPEFFAEESNWRRGLDWYRKQFASAGPDTVAIGEASTVYTKYPRYRGVPQRIVALIPQARLIYVIRDPIERIRSHYQHKVAQGSERAPLEKAVFENPIYVDCSRYALQIEQYLEYFPLEQLLVITLEDLRDARLATIRSVYQHLGVDVDFVPSDLGREFYRTNDRPARSLVPLWLRGSLKKHFPISKRAAEVEANILRIFNRLKARTEPVSWHTKSFTIPEAVRGRLISLLADDVWRLRGYMGPHFDGWSIGEEGRAHRVQVKDRGGKIYSGST
ncbi:MAG: sulfotransferase family protein [Gammaproteobacteria bacterium]